MENDSNRQSGMGSGDARQSAEDSRLEALFEHASRRPEPPEADRVAVMQAVRSEWQSISGKRRLRRRVVGFSLAAAVALAVLVTALSTPELASVPQPVRFAMVEKTSGNVRLISAEPGQGPAALARDMPVSTGQTIKTGNQSGAALLIDTAISLRIGPDTEIVLTDRKSVELRSGRVYVDTQAGESPYTAMQSQKLLEIITVRGAIAHMGTQFMVRLNPEELNVSVREGRVRFSDRAQADTGPLVVEQGQGLAVKAGGEREVDSIVSHGQDWEWAEELGPGFVLDGRTMASFFDWVAKETGLEVSYASPEAKANSETTVLHGKIDLPARQALDVVLLSSDLSATIGDGVIEISLKP